MRRKLFLLLALSLLGSAETMHLKEPGLKTIKETNEPKDPSETSLCEIKNSSLRLGGSYTYVWITPQNLPTFQGNLGGMQGIYEYRPNNSLYEGVKFAWRQGITHQASNSRFLLDFDTHERIGYTFTAPNCQWHSTLFTGIGYRYLGQTLKQPALSTLVFNYNEFYIPVGILLDGQIFNRCTLGINAIWMPQVYPAVTIIPLNGANWIIQKTLGNFLVELPITFLSQCEQFSLEIKPFFEYWQDGKTIAVSQSGIPLNTPRNTYLFTGAEMNLGWLF